MHPVLFTIAGYPVESAGVIYLLAAIVAARYAMGAARRGEWDPDVALIGAVLVLASGLAGAWLHGAWLAARDGAAGFAGGLSFFGGMVAGAAATMGFLRWHRQPIGPWVDAIVPVVPLLYALFRIGCLLNGDDYGPPTTLPWGVRIPEGSPPAPDPVHPTPLYEILLMVPVAWWIRRRRRAGLPAGALMLELCIAMGLGRFVAEFWRRSPEAALGLTGPQWLALALVATGVAGRGWQGASRRPA